MKKWISVLVIFGWLGLNGCALGTRHGHLTYPPENGESKGLIASAHASSARPSASRDILLTVSGNRTVMHLVGHVKNGFGMDMAAVETEDNIQMWVQDALTQELTHAGYNVTSDATVAAKESAIALDAESLKVYVDSYWTYNGDVELIVTLSRIDRKAFKRHYAGHGSIGINYAATAKGYGESLELALQDTISQLLVDLSQYEQ
jgi:hypothetical protein